MSHLLTLTPLAVADETRWPQTVAAILNRRIVAGGGNPTASGGACAESEPVPEGINDFDKAGAALGSLLASLSTYGENVSERLIEVVDVKAQPAVSHVCGSAHVPSAIVALRQVSSLQYGDSNSTLRPMTSR